VSRRTSAFGSVGLNGSYAFRTVTDDAGKTDFRLWSISVFNGYALPGRLSLNSALGVTGVTSDAGQSAGPNFFSASTISYEFARAVVSLALDSGFSETFSTGQDFGVVETQGISGSFIYRLTPWMTGTATAFFHRNKPTGIGNQGGLTEEKKNYGGTLGFSWRIQRRLLLDINYTHFQQVGSDTNVNVGGGTANQSYTENRVQASLRLSY
jgi:hypothetical protein